MATSAHSANQPSTDEMEALFVNNEKLDRITAHLNQFNPIKVMKMERMEIRHSAILAWLLDPSETHGFDDQFLKAFLSEALRGQGAKGYPTALDISQADLRDATIRREWKNIDVFILSEQNNWAVIVENKFDSLQHEGQLSKYASAIRSIFRGRNKELAVRGIFLTLSDEEPQDPQYSPINYATVCVLLSRLLKQEATQLSQEVTTFLIHYLNVLEDAVGMSDETSEMEKLARQLYRDHRKVLDFVIEHGASTDFAIAARTLFGDGSDTLDEVTIDGLLYVFDGLANSQVSFLPQSWYVAFEKDTHDWSGCEDWWAGYPLIAWLEIEKKSEGSEGQIKLIAEVGPLSNHEFRKALIQSIQETAADRNLKRVRFQNGATNEGKKYSRFFKENSARLNDVNDPEEIAKVMTSLLRRFENEFNAVASVLPQFKKYGE